MNHYSEYIEHYFSKELKLLLLLSQEKISFDTSYNKFQDINWELFIQLVLKHRLVSHVLKNEHHILDLIPKNICGKLHEIRLNQTKKALLFSKHVATLHNAFKKDTIPHTFFKGSLLSHELYNDLGFRNFKDIDILIDIEHIEHAKSIVEDLGFTCIYPKISLSNIQKKVNYSISHHYHFTYKGEPIEIELHWNITNPKSFFALSTKEILSNSCMLDIGNYKLPYISSIHNLTYLASHGSIHQWYRLFWLKDFSELLSKSKKEEIREAFELSQKLKLQKCFLQAIELSKQVYNIKLEFVDNLKIKSSLIKVPLKSISYIDLSQQGITGKIKFILYRLNLKKDFKYYFDLIYRLRTHLSDWEILKLPGNLFFLYYILRPFLLIYKFRGSPSKENCVRV